MTNPFLQGEDLSHPGSPASNPFLSGESEGKPYDSMPKAIGKEVLGTLLSPISLAGNLAIKDFNLWADTKNSIFSRMQRALEPNIAPDSSPALQGNSRAYYLARFGFEPTETRGQANKDLVNIAGIAPNLLVGAAEYKGVGSALDAAASAVPSTITSRVLTGVAKIAESITKLGTKVGLNPETASTIGGAAYSAITKQVPTAVATDLAFNPNSNKESLGINAGLASAFSAFEGYHYRQFPKYLYPDLTEDYHAFVNMPEASADEKAQLPDFVQRISNNIGEAKDTRTTPNLNDVYSAIVNGKYNFKVFEGSLDKPLMSSEKTSVQAQLSNGIPGMTQQFFNQPFTLDAIGNPTPIPIKGLKSALQVIDSPIKKNLLDTYALAKNAADEGMIDTRRFNLTHPNGDQATYIETYNGKHVVDYPNKSSTFSTEAEARADLENNGYATEKMSKNRDIRNVPKGMTPQDVIQTIKYVEDKFPEIAQAHSDMMQFNGAVRLFAETNGMISQRASRMFDLMAQNHISLNEAMGTSGKVLPPTKTIIDNASLMIRASMMNRVKLSLADLLDKNQTEWGYQDNTPDPVKTPIWTTVNKMVGNLGKKILDYNIDKEGLTELVTSMGPENVTPAGNGMYNMYVYKDGFLQKYKINEDLYEAVKSLSPSNNMLGLNLLFGNKKWVGNVANFLQAPARALSIGTVENPIFGFIHAIRDSYDATLNSKYGFRLGIDSWKGFMEGIGKGQYGGMYNAERLAAGGGYGTIMDSGKLLDKEAVSSILPQSPLEKTVAYVKNPIQLLRDTTRPFLEAARIGEYIRAREAGASAMEAALHSRNFIGDFGNRGSSGLIQGLSSMTAFMNPAIQSLDAEVRAFNPSSVGWGNVGKSAAKGMAAIGGTTAIFYALGYNDNRIQQLRQSQEGITNWFVPVPNSDKILKIPKPFIYGQVFGTSLEDALDKAFAKDPEGGKAWAKHVLESSEFSLVPTGMMTGINLYANRDNFSNRPIIPENLQGIDPQYQETPNTSNLAKGITSAVRIGTAGQVSISPIQMDYVIRSTFGTLGKGAAQVTGTESGMSKDLSDYPFFSKLIAKYPTYSTAAIENFYDKANSVDEVVKTANLLYKKGESDKFTKYVMANANKFALAPVYTETKAQLSELRTALLMTESNKDVSPETKKEMQNYIVSQIINITHSVDKATQQIH